MITSINFTFKQLGIFLAQAAILANAELTL